METIKDTNPFVAAVAKKQRGLKKKLEKIVKFEGQLAAGKLLDEEQLALVQSKKTVEKSLNDISSIKTQLEEIAKEMELASSNNAPAAEEEEVVVVERHTHTHIVTTSEQVTTEVEVDNNEGPGAAEALMSDELINSEDFHMKVVQYAVSTMTETDVDEVVVTAPPAAQVDVQGEQARIVYKLLKAFHVYNRYQDVTGHKLPDEFSFFANLLLGLTYISSQFGDALNNSCSAGFSYVNSDLSEVIRNINYAQMGDLVDQLAEEIESKSNNRASGADLTALLKTSLSMSTASVAPQPLLEEKEQILTETFLSSEKEISEYAFGNFGATDVTVSFQFDQVEDIFVNNKDITGVTITDEDAEDLLLAVEEVVEDIQAAVNEIIEEEQQLLEAQSEQQQGHKKKPRRDHKKSEHKDGEPTAGADEQGEKLNKKRDFKKNDRKKFHSEGASTGEEHKQEGKKHFKKHNNKPESEQSQPAVVSNEPAKPKSFLESVRAGLTQDTPAPQQVPVPSPAVVAPTSNNETQEKKPKDNRHVKKFENKQQPQSQHAEENTSTPAVEEQKQFVRREKKFNNNKEGPHHRVPKQPTTTENIQQSPVVPVSSPVTPPADLLEDGFQLPKNQAKKAKKAAEQAPQHISDRPQRPPFKPHHPKPNNNDSVPASKPSAVSK